MQQLVASEAPAEVIAAARAQAGEAVFYLWEENLPVYEFFCSVATQWESTSAGMAGSIPRGLNYASVVAQIALQVDGRQRQRKLFERIQLMERAALEVLHQRLEQS
ncbi:DUF1799 domain-containing protein [Cupriavidus pinatubonensis]|uniref:DUF1799 domain-containing protein n=1 Tax=Cupriavidus pinatubonensis TaxID=248026 RepID=UPI001C731675|nr:DUF1799 domain-containing protein [Cupriavidus pinatubonensis]QYY30305.1 DUF1799 domain-containing protein [Cupriavidus pinatubonensis]